MDALEQAYEEYLDVFGLRAALQRELELEDDYQEHVQGILRRADREYLASRYRGSTAFCGGGTAAEAVLRQLADSMPGAALSVGLPGRRIYCGLVPAGDFSVTTKKVPAGGIVLFDVALWFFLRLASQAVASALGAVTGSSEWGPDNQGGVPPGLRLRERLDGYLRFGEPLRQDTWIQVMQGPRDDFRRALNLAALAWILGHEYGHLLQPDQAPPPECPDSRSAELGSSVNELAADRCADRLVRSSAIGVDPLAAASASTVVLAIQAFALRTNHALGRREPCRANDVPEIRTTMSLEAIGAAAETRKSYEAATRLRKWLWTELGTELMFRDDVPEVINRS